MANMQESREIKNAKVTALVHNTQFDNYELRFEYPNILLPGANVQQSIRLFTRREANGAHDPELIAQVQGNIRESLGNENLNFNVPINPADPNDVAVYLKANGPVSAQNIVQNGAYFNLGSGAGSRFGNSRFLQHVDPKTTVAYDPQKQSVSFFDALTRQQQEAIQSIDTAQPWISASRNGQTTYAYVEGIIDHVVFSNANEYRSTPKQVKLADLITSIAKYAPIAENDVTKQILERIAGLPTSGQPYGLSNIVGAVGGMDAARLDKDPAVQTSIQALLKSVARMALIVYVKHPLTGYVYKMTQLRFPNEFRENSIYAETLQSEYASADIMNLPLQQLKVDPSELQATLVEKDYYNKDADGNPVSVKWDDVDSGLNVLNAVLSGRQITVRTRIAGSDGPADPTRLGTYIQSVGEQVGLPDMAIDPNAQAAPTSAEPAAQPDAAMDPFAANAMPPLPDESEEPNFGDNAEPVPDVQPAPTSVAQPAGQAGIDTTKLAQANPFGNEPDAMSDNPFDV